MEAGITMECIPIDNSDSFLAIWWAVFWDIFTARKRATQRARQSVPAPHFSESTHGMHPQGQIPYAAFH